MPEPEISIGFTQTELEALLPERAADVSALSRAHNKMRAALRSLSGDEWCERCHGEKLDPAGATPGAACSLCEGSGLQPPEDADANDSLVDTAMQAFCDPGHFAKRGDNYEESLYDWQRRALEIALAHRGEES